MAALSLPPPNSHLALEMSGGAPRFLCFPRSVTAPAGSQAVLRCRISGDPHPCVLWERVGNFLLELGERCLVQRDGEWYQLVISDLRPEDSGHYMCRASNWAGEGYAGAKLTVTPNLSITTDPHPTATFPCDLPLTTKLPPITTPSPALGSGADFLLSCKADLSVTPDIPPHFLLTPTSQRLSRGQSGELSCRISGKPEPTVRWEKDGRGLEELCDGSHYRVSPGGHSLHISHVRPPDAGVYVCRATNPAGECLAAAVLLVDPTPRQGPEPTPGESPAQVKVFTVNEGKHAKLRCLVTGKPRPEIIWRKDGRAVSPRRRTLIYEDRDGHFILKVLFCRQQDRGLYVCGASNTAGNTLSAVMLHVREVGEQFPAPLRDVSVREGQDAVLECSVPDGSRTSWFLEDQRLHPGKRHHMEEQGLVRRLIIRGARTDDDGVYVCQTQRGSQSIAEVAVRGPIVKRLPRRLEVAEGGNAAFCAETDSEVEQVGWTQDGQVLSEDHRTVLKSFGRTHVLVLVGVTLQDAGIIQFHAGLSESTCQLRVKARGLRVTPASEEPANRMLHAGQPISLSCHVPSSGAKVRWLKDGREVESGGRFSVQSDGRMRRLLISSAHASDTGSYTCHTANDSASFMVTVTEPPVKIVNTGDDTEHKCLNGERVVLSCEVSQENAPVRWYRDGVEMEETENVQLETNGKHRRLIIPNARSQDSGEFVCDAGDDSVFYNVTVTEPPVKIMNTGDDAEHKCLSGERVVLSCEVSRENAPVRWYRDGVEVGETESVRLESDGKHRRLIIPNARSQDSGEFVCDAGDDSVFYNVTVTEPLVKVVNTSDDTDHKCLSGERLVLSCEVSRENALVRWYRDGVEVEESENFRLESDGKHRRLIIPNARSQDSGEFVCDAGDDSVFYNVTVTEPPVKIMNTGDDTEHKCLSGERVVLSCEVSRESAPVRWYRDGVEVEETEIVRLESDGKHRRLIIPIARSQDSGEFVCDAGDDSVFYNVTVTEPPVKIVNTGDDTEHKCLSGEHVVLSCEVSRENAPVRWYKDGVEVEETENVRLESDGKHRRLIIPTARTQDSGEFVCDAGDDSVFYNVTVTEPPVKIVNTSDDTEHKCQSGERVVLSCEVSRENAPVRWYRDGVEVEDSESVRLESDGKHRRLIIPTARTQDLGEYVCDTGDDSVFYNVTVTEPPVKIVNMGDDTEHKCLSGERVVLSCEVSRENAPVRWYRDGVEVEDSESVRLESDGKHRRLIIPTARTQDSGEFVCDAGDDSVFYNVTVTEPPVKIVNTSDDAEHKCQSGERVVLSCEVSRDNVLVRWYKDGERVEEIESIRLESDGSHRRLIISTAKTQDSGEFVCDAGDDSVFYNVTVTEPPVKIMNTGDDTEHKCLSGERVVLSCEVSRENAPVRWYRDGVEVGESESVRLESDGKHRRLIIPTARAQDSGEFVCDAGDDSVFYNVTVTEPPVKIVNTSDDTELKCLSGERLVLSCEVSRESAPVRWYKDGVEVGESESVRVESDGKHRRLIIPTARSQDSGEFVCDARDDSVFYNVTVTEPPVKIVNTSDNTELKCFSGERVVLSCEVSRENAPVRWFRDDVEVEENESVRLESDGRRRRLIIPNARSQDSGEFVCDAGDDAVFYNVTVTEPPTRILFPVARAQDLEFVSGQRVELVIEVSRSNATVCWYKDGLEVDETESLHVMSEGLRQCLILRRATVEDSGEYICDTDSDSVTFDVRVLDPPVQILPSRCSPPVLRVIEGDPLSIECELSRCSAVQWCKDGQEVTADGNLTLEEHGPQHILSVPSVQSGHAGKYQCNVGTDARIFTVHVDEAVVRILEREDIMPRRLCTVSEDLRLALSLSRSDAEVRWYKNGERLTDNPHILVEERGAERMLTVLGVERGDAGEYLCDARHDSFSFYVTVGAPLVTIVGNTGTPEHHVLMTGDDLVLACELSKPNMKVRWLHDGEELASGGRVKILARGVHRQITILCARPSDTGTYTCDAATDQMKTTVQVEVPRQVEFVTEVQNVTVLEGEAATFKCVVSPDDVDLLWELNGAPVSSDKRVSMESNGLCHSLTLRSCRFLDSGIITANAEGNISRARLRVQEAQVLFAQGLQDAEVEEEQDVILQVQVTTERAEVHWVKQGVVIQPSSKFTLQDSDRAHSLTIHCVQPSDRGRYSCESLHDRTDCRLTVLPRSISVRKGLKDVHCEEGGKVELSVELSHDDLVGEWWKGGVRLASSDQCMIKSSGRQHFLHLSALTLPDSGVIAFTTDTLRTTAQLTVTEHPLSITQPPQDFVVNEAGAATFQCEVSKHEVTMTWSKDGVQLIPSSSCRMYSVGRRRILQLSNCRVEDAGTYTCHVGDCTASATLRVLEQEPQMVRDLQDAELAENENAVFTCEVSCAQAKGEWFKNGEKIKITTTTKIRQEGRKHFLLMCGVQCQDSGDITFRARRAESRAKLRVTELPVRIVKSLRDKTALQGHRVILECKVTPPRAQVTWLRRGHEINPSPKYQISSEDAFRKLVIADVTPEDEDVYTVSTTGGQSSARLLVEGLAIHLVRGVSAVTVTAPGDACFECELSVPMSRPPQWSLNGILLHSGPDVILENKGTRHKLTLRRTHPRMTGTVRFTAGKTRSEAQLTVKE